MLQALKIFWFRRDLRLDDNAGLYHALREGLPVLPLFIFDRKILDQLEDRADRRVEFIHSSLVTLQFELGKLESGLYIRYGIPVEIFKHLLTKFSVQKVYCNHDFEPYGISRDEEIRQLLRDHGSTLVSFKDHVIFEKDEVIKDNGSPYTIFTPYSRRWKSRLNDFYMKSYPVKKYFGNFLKYNPGRMPALGEFGFRSKGHSFPARQWDEQIILQYDQLRDSPSICGTSRMGVHLRFGTVSIRSLVRTAVSLNETFLSELIWREFFQMILWHFPRVGAGQTFRQEYELISWHNDLGEFERWCEGMTGYPMVDAGMRELNATGYMHNRVRMIVASFLTRHLLIDWRWGEAYFAAKLLDFELASNNGNWQWAAGCGCDAAPYFRFFNPLRQTQRFDPDLRYIKKWVPELATHSYPKPVVDHEFARKRCLKLYREALNHFQAMKIS